MHPGSFNSGKSTLAAALSRTLDVPAIHLDQLHHEPHTDWVPRPQLEFLALHAEAISGDAWIMDGNYSICLPERLRRATGLIVLDVSTPRSLVRYLRRSWSRSVRHGSLLGGKDSVKADMLWHIVVTTPKNRERYKQVFTAFAGSKLRLSSARAIGACVEEWNLTQ